MYRVSSMMNCSEQTLVGNCTEPGFHSVKMATHLATFTQELVARNSERIDRAAVPRPAMPTVAARLRLRLRRFFRRERPVDEHELA